jgi:hypothetical protein
MVQRQVTYVPPAEDVFHELAREVCRQLTAQGKTGYDDPEVIRGLADFLMLIAELTAKYLNRGNDDLLDR